MVMVLMISSLFLFGCGKEENNDSNKNNITYTNKFECIKEDKLTKDQIYYATNETQNTIHVDYSIVSNE